MLNMIDTQDKLKNFSERQLITEMQQPTGSAPQFMVLSEIERRKRMRQDVQRQEGLMQPTVAQEAISGAGVPQQGLAGLAQSLAPKTDMAQNTGVPNVQATNLPAQPNQPQRMAEGGVVRMAEAGRISGGTISAIANLKVVRPDLYEKYKDDPETLALTAEYYLTVAEDLEMTGLEEVSATRENDLLKSVFSDPTLGEIKEQRKRDDENFGDGYALDQRARSLINQRKAELAGNEGLFAEGAPVDYITGNTSAGFGGSTVPFPAADTPASNLPAGLGAFTMPMASASPIGSAETGIRSPSGFGGNPMLMPSMDAFPDSSIANAKADSDRDNVRSYLRGDSLRVPAIIDAIDRGNNADGDYTGGDYRTTSDKVIDDSLGAYDTLFFPESANDSDESKSIAALNRRAQKYMQGDMYTPPKEIYDLSPLGRLKYEEASDKEFDTVSNRLAKEAAAAEAAKENASLAAQDAAADAPILAEIARQAETRRMSRINEIPEKGYKSIAQKKKEADFTANNPFIGEVIDPIIETSIAGAGEVGKSAANLFEYARGFGPKARAERALEADFPQGTEEGLAAAAKANEDFEASLIPTGTGTLDITSDQVKNTNRRIRADAKAGGGGKGSGKTSSGSGSGQGRIADLIADRKKQGDQDKWLALAQAGLSLMTTGDVGKAGQEGLAALTAQRAQMNKFDTDMIKLESDLVLNNARLDAARRSGAPKAIPAGYLTDLRKQMELKQIQLASLRPAEEAGIFSGAKDPDAALRIRLENELQSIQGQIDFMYSSRGLPTVSGNAQRTVV